jgi:tRNA pseudouridine38-40 synthase
MAPRTVMRAANMRLPPAVRVIAAEEVGPEFHARFRAIAKTYRYRICNGDVLSPFEHPFAWHVPRPMLDLPAMDVAAARLVGTHDFAAFQGTGSDTETTVRTIFASSIARPAEGTREPLITYDVRADGFLRHMVRAIVGTLVEVGRGRKPASWMGDVLESRERRRAGPTAPAMGLFLVGVEYE